MGYYRHLFKSLCLVVCGNAPREEVYAESKNDASRSPEPYSVALESEKKIAAELSSSGTARVSFARIWSIWASEVLKLVWCVERGCDLLRVSFRFISPNYGVYGRVSGSMLSLPISYIAERLG